MASGVKTRRGAQANTRRFARTTAAPQGRFARSTTTPRRSAPTRGMRRRPAKSSGISKVVGSVLPGAAAAKATPHSKKGKAGGLALVAAAAGMAYKNRDKVAALRRKRTSSDTSHTAQTTDSRTNIAGPVPG